MITKEEQERDYQIHCAATDAADDELNHLEELTFDVDSKVDYDKGFIRGFKTGAAWADEHPKLQFFKFKDSQPEYGHPVIVYHSGEVFIAYLYLTASKLTYWNVYGSLIPVSDNDYWTPIPKLEEE